MAQELYLFTVIFCIEKLKVISKVYEMYFYHERPVDKFFTPCFKVLSDLQSIPSHDCDRSSIGCIQPIIDHENPSRFLSLVSGRTTLSKKRN